MNKIIKYNLFFLSLLAVGFLVSCGEDEPEEPLLSKRNDITSFVFDGLTPSVSGTINTDDHTVTATVPFGIDVTSLAPSIEVSEDAEIAPASGVTRDFSNPVEYIVTAENGDTQSWTVTVNVADPTIPPQLMIADQAKWKYLASESTLPAWFAASNGERNIAYHDQQDVLLVTFNDDAIRILNAETGADLGSLKDENNVITDDGASVKIGDVEVTEDGQIIASNITERPGIFRIHKWSTLDANAEVYIEFTNDDYRLGESINVAGELSGDAVITVAGGRIFSGEARAGDNRILQWTVTGGTLDPTPKVITVSALADPFMGTIPTALPRSNQPNTELFILGNAFDQPILIDNSGAILDTVKSEYIADEDVGLTNQMETFQFQGKDFMVIYSPWGTVDGGNNAFLLDITDDLDVEGEELLTGPGMPGGGPGVNLNGTGDVAIKVSDDGTTATFYQLGTNVGLWAYELTYGIPEE
jgi:hypothetical protein